MTPAAAVKTKTAENDPENRTKRVPHGMRRRDAAAESENEPKPIDDATMTIQLVPVIISANKSRDEERTAIHQTNRIVAAESARRRTRNNDERTRNRPHAPPPPPQNTNH